MPIRNLILAAFLCAGNAYGAANLLKALATSPAFVRATAAAGIFPDCADMARQLALRLECRPDALTAEAYL